MYHLLQEAPSDTTRLASPLCSHNALCSLGPQMDTVALRWSKGLSLYSSSRDLLDGKKHVLLTAVSGIWHSVWTMQSAE